MAIQKEIWEKSIVEGLFAPNSFLSKAFNADEYVEAGKIVHIPQGLGKKDDKNTKSFTHSALRGTFAASSARPRPVCPHSRR